MVDAPGTTSAIAANVTFTMLPADVDDRSTAVGPNDRSCSNNGTKTDVYNGESEFDGRSVVPRCLA